MDVLTRLSEICDLVEIQCDAKHSLFLYEDVFKDFDLRCTIHAPTGDGNIATPFESIRQASVEVIRETAEIGDRIGAETLVIHPGFCLFASEWEAASVAMMRSFEELGEIQENFSIRFAMENLGSWDCCMFQTPELLDLIRGAGLLFALDVGHANLTGTLSTFLRKRPDHLHLHDNCGKWDEHAACGSGMIDFSSVLSVAGSATMIVEVMRFEDVEQSLMFLENL
ncbi:MAG: sugar phosphate isomerase/epimerase [Methanocalculaceae archaeon]|nr:sugar phosphate isomerase/epimerase [Methanocalculaceae archaeon]